jgi:dienelactone hydrolase
MTAFRSASLGVLVGVVLAFYTEGSCMAQTMRVLPAGQVPADQRLKDLKDLNGYFPFAPPTTREAWEPRAEQVRLQIRVATGLWPEPERTPLNAVIHGRLEQPGYTLEKVYFESMPGFFVTGNLYRPVKASGRVPGVLCPHGHWPNGRFTDCGVDNVRKQIVQGAERFELGGRSPLQSRCMQLARMGCVVFHYDMVGYADSTQLSFALAHGFATQRPEMNAAENWGLFSPQAESHLQSIMGLQTWSSIRALDFLVGLPEVDASRLGVTGASGGGTQTFLLAAIDPRVTVSVPAVMVSTAMQGGCTCENASLLRVDTGNIEFAALFAPKPQCLLSADDWTKEMPSKGFPQLQEMYRLLGAPDAIGHHPFLHFQHNYNYVSRAAMYAWMNQHFNLGLPTPVVEEDYPLLSAQELTVWDEQHPRPAGGDEVERALLRWWHEDSRRRLAALAPVDAASLQRYREVVGGGWRALLGRGLPAAGEVSLVESASSEAGGIRTTAGLVRCVARGEELPVVLLEPKAGAGRVALWLHGAGKSGLFQADGQVQPAVRRLLDAGVAVVGVDLLYQGEFLPDGAAVTETRRVKNPREAASYTFGYNHALFAQRSHDVLTMIAFLRQRFPGPATVWVVGLEGGGAWAAVALTQAREAVAKAALDTAGFRFGGVTAMQSPDFLPGGAKYDDVPGALALAAPTALWLAGEGAAGPAVTHAAYAAAGAANALTVVATPASAAAAVAWLLSE